MNRCGNIIVVILCSAVFATSAFDIQNGEEENHQMAEGRSYGLTTTGFTVIALILMGVLAVASFGFLGNEIQRQGKPSRTQIASARWSRLLCKVFPRNKRCRVNDSERAWHLQQQQQQQQPQQFNKYVQ